jgi:hypothetical protein
MENQDGNNINQREETEISEIPDLALTMQAMSLADPGLCRIQDNEVKKQELLDFSCCLIMKVASTGGTPRALSQHTIEEALSRAWKDKFKGISQVSSSVFMAHFKSQDDMISVYIKQPWVVNSENLLVDWFDPNLNATSSANYKFDSILVTVRAYGIPRNKRSISLLKNILNQVGEVSDFHILQESNLFAKQDYIWGTAKLMVNTPLKDKALVSFQDGSSTVVYLHYEKIKRACLFCGIMFHNAQDCKLRNSLVSARQRNRQSSADIPSQRFGQWIINEKMIPAELVQTAAMGDQISSQAGSAMLQRLRDMFAEDPKGKGKLTEYSSNAQLQSRAQGTNNPSLTRQACAPNLVSVAVIQKVGDSQVVTYDAACQNEKHSTHSQGKENHNKKGYGLAEVEGDIRQQESRLLVSASLRHPQTEGNSLTQGQPNEQVAVETPARMPSSKRSAPLAEDTNQPEAKKQMAIQNEGPGVQGMHMQMMGPQHSSRPSSQYPIRPTSPYNPSLTLAQNAHMMNSAFGYQNFPAQQGILGAAPSHAQLFAIGDASPSTKKAKHRPSRWDVQAQGSTSYTLGAATWRRNAQAPQVQRSSPATMMTAVPASPCKSDANSAAAGYYDHDSWPLHTPTNSFSQHNQDCNQGVFSPPQVDRDLYEAPSYQVGSLQEAGMRSSGIQVEKGQAIQAQTMVDQTQGTGNNDIAAEKAEAPAFKAPHAQ